MEETTMGADLSIFGRTEAGKPIQCAQPFARAAAILREADALVERRPLRRSRMRARLLEAANRAQDEELQLIFRELRQAIRALRSAAENDSHGSPRR